MFNSFERFDIEAVGKREFVKICGDGFGLQDVNSPQGKIDICIRMTGVI
ncbi:MAG: hypothetical protein WCG52_03370 [bacterium]